jgi:nucleotide-binding universal stress UspA family protein
MPPFSPTSILCPVDFSDPAKAALRYGVGFASRYRARVTAVYVDDPLLAEAAAIVSDPEAIERESLDELRRFIDAAVPPAPWRPEVDTRVRVGAPADAILELAEGIGAGLIVLGTHGLSGYRKLFFGSTTERVLRKTRVPILVVPRAEHDLLTLEPSGPVFRKGPVVAPVDLGELPAAHAVVARDVAARFEAPLLLLHVVTPGSTVSSWRVRHEDLDASRRAEARRRLDALAKALGIDGEVVVATGNPAEEIAGTAAARHAGLIVMGLRETPGAFGSQPGSVAYRVLTLTATPVVALPGVPST